MSDFTNHTFDEIDVGAAETATRTVTATDIEALSLAAGDVDGFHLDGADPRRSPRRRRARRPSR